MSLLLLLHSYPGANETVKRHWPYYLNAGADEIIGIETTDGLCNWPDKQLWPNGKWTVKIGGNSYINGPNLCHRLMDTLEYALSHTNHDQFCIAEYDVLFFDKIPAFTGTAAHHTGTLIDEGATVRYFHPPWCCDRRDASDIVGHGRYLQIHRGIGSAGQHCSSPDVFFGRVVDALGIKIKTDLMRMHTQNSYDIPGSLEKLCERIEHDGVNVCHGIKTAQELKAVEAALRRRK